MKEIKEAYAKQSLPNSELKKQAEQRIQDFLVENIATPRYMTIQDLFSDGDRMGVMTEFAPEVDRGLNAIFGTKIFDPATKSIVDLGEAMPRKKEAQMKAELEKANDLQKAQRDYANSVYKQINDLEIADRKLTQDADQFAQNLAFERERLAEERRHNRAVEANGGIDRPSFSNITTARKEFNSSPQVTYYNEITRRKNDIKAIKNALGSKGRLNATDQALIMNFNKALDPISVVRESEFGRTAAGQSLADQAEGALLKVFRGGSGLSTAEREAVSQVIDIMADEARKTVIPLVQDRVDLARRYNINPSDIVGSEYQKLLNQSANNSQSDSTREMYIKKLKAKGYSDSKINQYLQYKGL